jgi:hypothetical protein
MNRLHLNLARRQGASLIIVLVMIGIGLAKSVKKVLSELPLVSEEEHVKLKEELAKIVSNAPIEEKMGRLEISGLHSEKVKLWMRRVGF